MTVMFEEWAFDCCTICFISAYSFWFDKFEHLKRVTKSPESPKRRSTSRSRSRSKSPSQSRSRSLSRFSLFLVNAYDGSSSSFLIYIYLEYLLKFLLTDKIGLSDDGWCCHSWQVNHVTRLAVNGKSYAMLQLMAELLKFLVKYLVVPRHYFVCYCFLQKTMED